ncbi:GNAT family N-acetyltransferase [Paenibacillus aestuarii]|uniref:GNAT family N-acetyltransferase n=1 Tax=Paenibacillus aestuarii TaxID=516965 RepID=A0ABW0K9Z3_9BACL|nr:GNAT family N-acetyltransferase [Paenibacillus aestuarii]
MNIICRTERMDLVQLDTSSADLVLDYVVRNRQFLAPWEPERNEEFYTLAHQEALLQQEMEKMKDGHMFKVWMLQEGRVIGSAALSNMVRGAFQSCHLGYKMDHEQLNKGLMTEALSALVAYAFEKLKLHRIEANIMPRNIASLQVVKKLGFYDEGLALKYLKIHGVWEDHIHMVLRNEAME